MTPQEFVQFAAAYEGAECLPWPFATSKHGYGMVWDPATKQVTTAHRAVCKAAHGEPLFDGADAAHDPACTTLLCVNQAHLRWATRTANNEDWGARATLTRKPRRTSKLTTAAVESLRAGRMTPAEAAAQFGVTEHHVRYGVLGGLWWRWA